MKLLQWQRMPSLGSVESTRSSLCSVWSSSLGIRNQVHGISIWVRLLPSSTLLFPSYSSWLTSGSVLTMPWSVSLYGLSSNNHHMMVLLRLWKWKTETISTVFLGSKGLTVPRPQHPVRRRRRRRRRIGLRSTVWWQCSMDSMMRTATSPTLCGQSSVINLPHPKWNSLRWISIWIRVSTQNTKSICLEWQVSFPVSYCSRMGLSTWGSLPLILRLGNMQGCWVTMRIIWSSILILIGDS